MQEEAEALEDLIEQYDKLQAAYERISKSEGSTGTWHRFISGG